MTISPLELPTPRPRFAYVNLILQNSGGITGKLEDQAAAAREAAPEMDVIWLTRGSANETRGSGLIVRDMGSASRLQCRVRQMKELRRMQLEYGAILLRYPLCDPITFMGLRRPFNIASEHHTKEVPELKMTNDPRFVTELALGSRFLRRFAGFFAVTDEILGYEQKRSLKKKPGFVTYNAISTNRFPASAREASLWKDWPKIRFVTASSTFCGWQGLDLILEAFSNCSKNYELHVCGEVTGRNLERARTLKNVILYGSLKLDELLSVYSKCDVGIASFGLHRKGLSEATTLKVREYLACGLPVVMSHRDPAFQADFLYVRQMEQLDLAVIAEWCDKMRSANREEIFRLAQPYISIETLIRKQVRNLNEIFESFGTTTCPLTQFTRQTN